MVKPGESDPIRLPAAAFDLLFPFHVGFGPDGKISSLGRSLRKVAPAVQPGQLFADAFVPVRPAVPFTWSRLAEAAGRLQTIRERSDAALLRGQFQVIDGRMYFLGTLWLADTSELERRSLMIDDFAAHDPTLDLLQVLQLQKIVADDLQGIMAQLKQKSAQVTEAARAKDAFIAGISHELRTPLTGILGMAEILAEQIHGPLNEQQLRDIRIVHASGTNLLKLINNVIDLAKVGAGQADLKKVSCPIESFCGPAFERARVAAGLRRQVVTFTNDAPGVHVAVDARRMTEVLTNLLSNAAKFTAEGGEFGLRATATDREVRLEVWDHGIGIEPANVSKLFQPFVQLDGRLARRYDGTGVGLALVRQWVDLHGGRVEVESTPGVGSRFAVVLERAKAGAS
jgi:signal transduction histidine kinase